MKALLHTEPYVLEYTDLPDPEASDDEVIVRPQAVGICGSDVHGYTGESGRRVPPIVMGHEASGVVEWVGPGTENVAVGDRVCFDSTVFCNACAACRAGTYNRCERRQVLGVSAPGMPKRHGCMAELVALPWWTLLQMPDELSFQDAALLEPVSIALHAVRRSQISDGESVLIIGCGTIGLFILQAARLAGAGRIIVSDLDGSRLELAAALGADVTVQPPSDDLADAVGGGVDVSFEVVGFPATLHQAVRSARIGGRVVLVGNLTPRVELGVADIISRELTLIGTYASSGEYRDAVDLVAGGRIDVSPVVGDVRPLSDGQRSFDRLREGEPGLVKIVLLPQTSSEA